MTLIWRTITMTLRTDGIVIREQSTGEQDRLITILTQKHGIVKGFVNGARNPKNKNVAATDLLCYSDFYIEKNKRDVYVIKEATSKHIFFALRENITLLSLAQYFAQLSFELAPREEEASEFLSLLLNRLYLLSQNKKSIGLIKAATELRMLSLSGYMPNLVACSGCGCYENERMFFSCNTGMLFCPDCLGMEKTTEITMSVLSAMRHICFCEKEKVFSFNLSDESVALLCDVTENYVKKITNGKYKTLDFYKMMSE